MDEYNRPRYLVVEERRKPSVTLRAVAADIDVIAHNLAKSYPNDYPKRFSIWTDSLASDVVGDSKRILYALIAAVAMLLIIACSDVANLLLERATVRQGNYHPRISWRQPSTSCSPTPHRKFRYGRRWCIARMSFRVWWHSIGRRRDPTHASW